MKHNKFGFSVLEMIISIMISAMLLTAGLMIYNQISKMAIRVQRITHLDSQILILQQRLSTDLNGLAPLWFSKKTYSDLKKNNEKQTKDIQEEPRADSNTKNNNFLYAQSSNKNLEILTFASTNALQLFSDSSVRCVRVIYVLKPEENDQTIFKLMRRQENTVSTEFNLEELKQGRFYTIVDNVKQCTLEYGFVKKSENNKSKFTFVSEWGNDKTKEKEKNEDKKPDMPDLIKLTLTIQSNDQNYEQKYEIFCKIPTCHATVTKPFAQKRKEEEKQNTPTDLPAKGSMGSIAPANDNQSQAKGTP